MPYDTTATVQYRRILDELRAKAGTPSAQGGEDGEDGEEFSEEDAVCICERLHRDELATVFGAVSIVEDVVDRGIAELFAQTMTHPVFSAWLHKAAGWMMAATGGPDWAPEERDLRADEREQKKGQTEEPGEKDETTLRWTFYFLFNIDVFYLAHPIFCRFLTTGAVDEAELARLSRTVEHLLLHATDVGADV